ncbi:[protein-PII] uridylyltransferase [Thalassotalea agarivorans]|uniref:Bifunctional uridylyltransferase/uridylyl-removing enzyme n=1 Tax=Thalassotalea agarivorans TaxID=349064 RepID=A0A1I0DLY5_THASX|nr:[protein-PII] uridylyltransferase [Thalassotalea agarivorans]SET33489.1 UTP--GlnB (protein PII) uridylyltransferase, GlnD [Thalassotalea agarivorans]
MNAASYIPQHLLEPFGLTQDPLTSAEIVALSEQFKQWLKDAFSEYDITELVSARAYYVDQLLSKLWCQHQLDEDQISLIAVGGYGRGELHPYSDVDLLILTQNKIDKALEEKISMFITQLWDVRLDVGQSVRSIKECLKQAVNDVTVATNLMESRLICGNTTLADQLFPLLQEDVFWTSKKFFIAKRDEQQKRHSQYHGAAYTLEPNLKANPGGLRDIQTIGWVAKRHFVADSLEELVQHNYLTRNEYFELLECQDYLWRMRFALHLTANRSENRLLFDYQSDVAKLLGFGDEGKAAVERMMKRFFRIIGRIAELNKMLLQHFEYDILKQGDKLEVDTINRDFIVVDGLIKATNERVFMRSVKIMEMFLIIAQHENITGLHSETLRLMRNARRRLVSGLQDYAECRRIFIELFRHPRGLGLAFNLMHRHSILGAYLPEWRSIVGQMQFDLFHAYSVDEHSYRLIKNLYRFSQTEHNDEFPLCSKIVQRMRKPEVLYLAGVFHDIAKGRGGDHAILGAQDALSFGKRHKLNDHDTRMIAWLVEQHLTMSITAQRRDISDEQVIKEFADIVSDEQRLDLLYCLTVADMRATNESLWNSWKANLLEELYYSTKQAFRRGLEKPVDLSEKINENKEQAQTLLVDFKVDSDAVELLWQEFKEDYFLRYSPEQIAWHTRHILNHDRSKPLVLISPKPYRGGTEVFVFTKEKENIFANTVMTLGSKRLSIHDAKIITSKTGFTVNTFVILDQRNKPIDDNYRALEIANALTECLSRDKAVSQRSSAMPKHLKPFNVKTRTTFIDKPEASQTMLEIVALDHPGLLAGFASVFQRCNIHIHSAKITTFGEKAEDMFMISNAQNQPLSEHEKQELTELLSNDVIHA